MKTGALNLSYMSKASYEPSRSYPVLPPCVWSYHTSEYVEIRQDGRTLYIIFRGSNDIMDWIRNVDLHMRQTPQGAIHHGFRRGWMDLLGPLESRLFRLKFTRVICTGHSRGGPLAIMCHEFIDRVHDDITTASVTFGCPRFCDSEYLLNTSHLDIVNYQMGWFPFLRDPVPHIPPGQHRPGDDISLRGFGRPSRMHPIDRYVNQLSK